MKRVRSHSVTEGFSQGVFLLVPVLRIRIGEMLQDTRLMNPIRKQDPHLIINQSLLWAAVTEGKVNDQPSPLHTAY